MAFVNKVNGIPIDEFLAVNPNWIKVPALDKYGNPYLFEDGTPQYTIIPKSEEEIPTVDPFSGQQISAQDQAAFTQPQDIFSTNLDGITSLIDSIGAKPNQFTTEEGYKKIGEDNSARRQSMMDSLSSAYSGITTLATIPATFLQSLVGLDLPGSGFRTEAMEKNLADIISQKGVPQGTIGYEDFGLNFGQEGSVLKNIINNKAGLANALTLGRVGYNVDPSTGKINFSSTEYDFSPEEISFANKFSRPVLEFLSKGGAFGNKPITLNPNVKLSSNDPILNSLTENFNNLSLQQMNQIRNTPREVLIEQARSGGQKGGIGYLLGF